MKQRPSFRRFDAHTAVDGQHLDTEPGQDMHASTNGQNRSGPVGSDNLKFATHGQRTSLDL